MLVLNIDDLTKVNTNSKSSHPPKPTQAQRDPFAMLYLYIVIHGKCEQSRTHPEGLANKTTNKTTIHKRTKQH